MKGQGRGLAARAGREPRCWLGVGPSPGWPQPRSLRLLSAAAGGQGGGVAGASLSEQAGVKTSHGTL